MRSTLIWLVHTAHTQLPSLQSAGIIAFLFLAAGANGPPSLVAGQEEQSAESHESRAQRVYQAAKARYQTDSSSARSAWEFARACYDLAEFASTNSRREEIALEGIAACRSALEKHPRVAPAHYYLALNLGQQARTKTLGALGLVDEMESRFLRSIQLDRKFDFAGAHRAAGILYRDAPGWPVSIGSKTKARSHLETALALFPDYPGNHIALLESHLEWGESERASQRIEAARKVMQSAKHQLTGERWALSWEEWEAKWRKILSQIPAHPEEDPSQASPR